MCSKLSIKTSERRHCHISHLFPVWSINDFEHVIASWKIIKLKYLTLFDLFNLRQFIWFLKILYFATFNYRDIFIVLDIHSIHEYLSPL